MTRSIFTACCALLTLGCLVIEIPAPDDEDTDDTDRADLPFSLDEDDEYPSRDDGLDDLDELFDAWDDGDDDGIDDLFVGVPTQEERADERLDIREDADLSGDYLLVDHEAVFFDE